MMHTKSLAQSGAHTKRHGKDSYTAMQGEKPRLLWSFGFVIWLKKGNHSAQTLQKSPEIQKHALDSRKAPFNIGNGHLCDPRDLILICLRHPDHVGASIRLPLQEEKSSRESPRCESLHREPLCFVAYSSHTLLCIDGQSNKSHEDPRRKGPSDKTSREGRASYRSLPNSMAPERHRRDG